MTTDRAYRERQETKEREALDRETAFISGYPIRPYAPRYVLGAYTFIVITATTAMLAGVAGMLLGAMSYSESAPSLVIVLVESPV
jgi:hypothetical protein